MQVNAAKKDFDTLASEDLTGEPEWKVNLVKNSQLAAKEKLDKLTIELDTNKVELKKLTDDLNDIATKAIAKGYGLVIRMANAAMEQAKLSITKGILSGLTGPGMAAAMAEVNLREIELQKEQNSLMASLNNTMLRANILKEKELAEKGITDIKEAATKEGRTLTAAEQLQVSSLKFTSKELDIVLEALAKGSVVEESTIRSMGPAAAGLAAQVGSTTSGTLAKNTDLDAKKRIELNNKIIGQAKEERDELIKSSQAQAKMDELKRQQFELGIGVYEYLSKSNMEQKQAFERQKQMNDQSAAKAVLDNEIADINLRMSLLDKKTQAQAIGYLEKLKKSKETQLTNLDKQKEKEIEILGVQQLQARIANDYAKVTKDLEHRNAVMDLQQNIQLDSIRSEQELFAIRSQLLLLTPDEIAAGEKRLKLQELEVQASVDRSKVERDMTLKRIELAKQEALVMAAGDIADEEYFNTRRKQIDELGNLELRKINEANAAKRQAIDLQYSMTDRMKAYDETFQNAFKGMGDAMVEFAKTGKLSFNSLISDMIAGLIRYEMQLQALEAYKAMRPGIMNAISSFFGNGGFGTGSAYGNQDYGQFFAKGGTFDTGGIHKFAKGGIFSNQIVNSPTLFKFANGTGLMGEAGPEAIMPLKRDSNGSLGVTAHNSSPKVDVVVNNFSGAKTETKETVDNKGNRKIEVIVGEMVAGEMARTNSPMQQTMGASFGTRPTTVRR